MNIKIIFFGFVALCLVLVAIQAARIGYLSHKMDYDQHPYTRQLKKTKMKVLFLGDSTAVGTGSQIQEQTTAGWLGQEFPRASIENISANGLKLSGLLDKLSEIQKKNYDLIIVQIGANDVIHLTRFSKIKENLKLLFEEIQGYSSTIIVLHSGDIGTSPMFFWPFSSVLSKRSYELRELYKKYSQQYNFRYVDLIAMEIDQQFLNNINQYYAPDLLHLSGQGYHIWYNAIRSEMEKSGTTIAFK